MIKLFKTVYRRFQYWHGHRVGYKKGLAQAKVLAGLIERFGTFGDIPTREFRAMGDMAEEMAQRQRLLIAIDTLSLVLERLGMSGIPNLSLATAQFLALDPTGTYNENLKVIMQSSSVFKALVDHAVVTDDLDKQLLDERLQQFNMTPVYYQLCENSYYLVD
jgi:hypothetical protein